MGSSHSVQSRDERRRSNRLFKPPTKNATISPTSPISPCQASAVTTDALPWQNPWTGTTIPVSLSVHDHRARRSQSFPSRPPHFEAPWGLANEVNVAEERDESSPQSPCMDLDQDVVCTQSSTQVRPPTPSDSEYTHLGNLKLGSLRVVNGSASPSPSERSRLDEARGSFAEPDENAGQSGASWRDRDVGQNIADASPTSEWPENATSRSVRRLVEECLQDASEGQPVKKPLSSLLRIPSLSDSKKFDDFPASPFSFEKSPINIYPQGQDPYLSSKEIDDEGISVADDGEIFDHRATPTATEKPDTMKSGRLHRKADSGYSSANSVRSLQDGCSRASIDSQASRRHSLDYHPFALGDTARTFQPREESSNQLVMRRHVSLQGHRASLMVEA
ncbi:hypothetical protein BA78_3096, partial [Aspergillus fumigatus]